MSKLVCVKKQSKSKLSGDQKTFQRLKSRVESLKEKEKIQTICLDEALSFYHEKIRPETERLDELLQERVELSYQIYKTKQSFSKRDRKLFKQLILDDLNALFQSGGMQAFSPEIEKIANELDWGSCKDVLSDQFQSMIDEIQEMFLDQGVQLDLSNLNMQDGEEEMSRKLFESVQTGMNAQEQTIFQKHSAPKPSEAKLKIEEMQKKSINTIYKQLAKAFHPDLEQDTEKKRDKEELMKKLTVAYENKDLYSLLDLEMEWVNSSRGAPKVENLEQLKLYNGILRDQVRALEERIHMLFLHPRYLPIQSFYSQGFTGISSLFAVQRELQEDIKSIKSLVHQLQGPSPQVDRVIKKILQQEHMYRTIEDQVFSDF